MTGTDYTLVIGDKNYSSWSLRPWLAMKACGVPFEEERIWLRRPDSKAEIFRHSPSGKVPALKTDIGIICDSLAIVEYLAEQQNLVARIEAAQAELDRLEQGAQLAEADQAASAYRAELVQARKALRRVQGDLRRDIEALESRLTWANIIIMPLMISALAVILAWRQRRRRLATQKAGGLIVDETTGGQKQGAG